MKPFVRKAYLEDVLELSQTLREADIKEILASTGEDSFSALLTSFMRSKKAYSVEYDGRCIAMFGVADSPLLPLCGVPWLLASEELVDNWRIFARESRKHVEDLQEDYAVLYNFVDARNDKAINWLKWCGFTFTRQHDEYGVAKIPFIQFERKKLCV